MLEDKVAFLLQKYLGNYVKDLSKEDLKISVWRGDVELTNMELRPEALNALKLPVKVKAGFLGSVRLKVPWSRLGQEPVLVYLDRIFLLVEPATNVEGCTDDSVQEAKRSRVKEMEMKLLESKFEDKDEMNTSWLGSLINTVIGNIKLAITNIHVRYEDTESNPGHPFAAGMTLEKLASVTVGEDGKETFITGGALEYIQKSVELERLAVYFDSDVKPWEIGKPWEDLLPSEWSQIFEPGVKTEESISKCCASQDHSYLLQPIRGDARYVKLGSIDSRNVDQPLQKAIVNLDDVTLCLSQAEYRDMLKLAENISAFNRRLKYAHYRPLVGVHANAKSWWQYACKVLVEQQKRASGHLSWDKIVRYTQLCKRYVSRYVACLEANPDRTIIDDDKEIQELDCELEIEVILQWRMLAHNFVERTIGRDVKKRKQKSWWQFGRGAQNSKNSNGNETRNLTEEEMKQLNELIGYKEHTESPFFPSQGKLNVIHTLLEVHMQHNASKLIIDGHNLTELSCEGLHCSVKLYPDTKIFDVKLQSYQLGSPEGLLVESATEEESLNATFSYMPFDRQVDWSLSAKASPCYMTYLKAAIDRITRFFESSSAVSQIVALETAAAVQMTLNEVKRSAQEQLSKALQDRSRFSLNLDIAAPKIAIPTEFCPDGTQETRLLLDLGYFTLNTEEMNGLEDLEEKEIYMQFKLGLKDISAFLVDGDYDWREKSKQRLTVKSQGSENCVCLPVLDECAIFLSLQQIRVPHPLYPATRLAVRLPSLGFQFSPSRYHRLMQVAALFQNDKTSNSVRPWYPTDFDGYLSVLAWKGVGNREAVWQHRYAALVGQFLYILESPSASSYKHRVSLRGKQVCNVPKDLVGNVENVLAICDAGQYNSKVAELVNTLILRCDDENSAQIWQRRLQGAIYRASDSAAVNMVDEIPDSQASIAHESTEDIEVIDPSKRENIFLTGVLDEMKVTFFSSHEGKQDLKKVLLGRESRLLEFRALGSKVEISMREYDVSIGVVLQSLEIEDAFGSMGNPSVQFLARSFIEKSSKAHEPITHYLDNKKGRKFRKAMNDKDFEDNECFFEASESPVDSSKEFQSEASRQPSESSLEYLDVECSSNGGLSCELPSFRRIPWLLPCLEGKEKGHALEQRDKIDSFVKAQVILFKHDSPAYVNIDKQVMLSLATLSFFCNRPTILAILNFMNAINIEEMKEKTSEKEVDAIATIMKQEPSEKDVKEEPIATLDQEEPVVKGLLGRGKDRIVFSLVLSMQQAQIVLNNENGTQLAILSQDNLHTDIKVFPSSVGVMASLGNLKVSDNSLDYTHPYYWICDMRNPGGSSFVELEFVSFNPEDEDYQGYEYSLVGKLSEVRVVYLNRFIQELVSYFMGLTSKESNSIVKLKNRVTNFEKSFTKSEIEGSPALRLDLSLRKPIIIMPRRTDSKDFLELDVLSVTVQNSFKWIGGDKNEINAVHIEFLSLQVQDVNLAVGVSGNLGERIIEDVNGFSLVIRRSLRDLWHQIPSIEAVIKIEKLNVTMSDKEYQIITECVTTNISETPNIPPALDFAIENASDIEIQQEIREVPDIGREEPSVGEAWTTMQVIVDINQVELSLHTGRLRDSPLATIQISGGWVLFKSNSEEESIIMATLKSFNVIDDRQGTREEFRRAIGKSDNIEYAPLDWVHSNIQKMEDHGNEPLLQGYDWKPVITMLILDVKLNRSSQKISMCIQRPQLLVALDFLLAVTEFFVPSILSVLSDTNAENTMDISNGIILDQVLYCQCHDEVTISPIHPLVVDDGRYDSFIYDGRGGRLQLANRVGVDLAEPSKEAFVFIGSGKKLQFKNVIIQNGEYLDSCILLGANSSYSALEDDGVFLQMNSSDFSESSLHERSSKDLSVTQSRHDGNTRLDLIFDLQAIGPEFTFVNNSIDNEVSAIAAEKLLHAEVDIFSRFTLKGDNIDLNVRALGLTLEASSGVRVVEPFDTIVNFSKVSGRTNIHIAISEMFVNFSYSILYLLVRIQEDIFAFLAMSSKKSTVMCSQFDKIWADERNSTKQKCAFWRPQAPPGFAVLGDCLTPLDEPPSKGVLALNTSNGKVRRPLRFELIWSSSKEYSLVRQEGSQVDIREINMCTDLDRPPDQMVCSVWMPIPPQGFVALGCVVSTGREQPPLSSALCVSTTLVTPCPLKDCIFLDPSKLDTERERPAFWRVDNSVGTFLPTQSETGHGKLLAYDFRFIIFGYNDEHLQTSIPKPVHGSNLPTNEEVMHLERSASISSGRRYESVAQFELVWWNRGSSLKKKVSIWRPQVPSGYVYLGDIATPGFEPPNESLILHDLNDGVLLKPPLDFIKMGQIYKHRGVESISFWLPQAPPGYVSLGCIASKSPPKLGEFNSLRCIRNDLVTGDQFPDNSIWDTTEIKHTREDFSIWMLDSEAGTFLVRSGIKKPPRRFALRLADQTNSSEPDDLVIDAQVQRLSTTFFDDFGGLMVPLLNISFTGIMSSLHGRLDHFNSTVNLSLVTRSYNEKHDFWEPLIEPVDGFVRYQYDKNSAAPSQVRMSFTKDLNMNVSVANVNMILEAFASWNKLNEMKRLSKTKEQRLSTSRRSLLEINQKKTYYMIPQNKLGQDIFLRTVEFDGQPEIMILPSGDIVTIKVPASKSILDSHSKENLKRTPSKLIAVVIGDAELPVDEGIEGLQYMVAIRIIPQHLTSGEAQPHEQSARTTCAIPHQNPSSQSVQVQWNEVFYFKVDTVETQMIEIIITDLPKGRPVGSYSTSLTEAISLRCNKKNIFDGKEDPVFSWRQLCLAESRNDSKSRESQGKIRCAMFISSRLTDEMYAKGLVSGIKPGIIQIGPTKEGPWTTVSLNYSTSTTCWRMGHVMVASEVSLKGSNKYVIIRSLVSVLNQTDFAIDLHISPESLNYKLGYVTGHDYDNEQQTSDNFIWDEVFENERYNPLLGWGSSFPGHLLPSDPGHWSIRDDSYSSQEFPEIQVPLGWEWASDWYIDKTNSTSPEGWTYAFDFGQLKWPPPLGSEVLSTSVKRRRWIRKRKCISKDQMQPISVGVICPADMMPLPVACLNSFGPKYALQLKPQNFNGTDRYDSGKVLIYKGAQKYEKVPHICVSSLVETEALIYCPAEVASSSSRNDLWFCLSVKATEIGKDIHLDPIRDWKLVLTAPLTFVSFLPVESEFSILEKLSGGELSVLYRGVIKSGQAVKVYCVDLQKPLYFCLFIQGGWQPIHHAVLISHPTEEVAQFLTLKNLHSDRKVQVLFDYNQDGKAMVARVLRLYTPHWLQCMRCPPLQFRFISTKQTGRSIIGRTSKSSGNLEISEQIIHEEMQEGCTIFSSFDPKFMGLSVALNDSRKTCFGPPTALAPLSEMDGSVDLKACDGNGLCIRLLVTKKTCPYQYAPTKVICICPYVEFTNRTGKNLFIKLNENDQPKTLHASACRVAYCTVDTKEPERLQVQLEDTEWSYPFSVKKEDIVTVVMRQNCGKRQFLRAKICGYDEGSRFLIVFRLGSINAPFRIENRSKLKLISCRQSGLDDKAWQTLKPFSTLSFSWEDPYGQHLLDVLVENAGASNFLTVNIEKVGDYYPPDESVTSDIWIHVAEVRGVKVVKFFDDKRSSVERIGAAEKAQTEKDSEAVSDTKNMVQSNTTPLEFILELGILGVSIVDQRPREILYLYLERVFFSYSTGYGGNTSRLKLLLGYLQLDNQLPLTNMPVLLAPEIPVDLQHPILKMNFTMSNENFDGTQLYPYIGIRVTQNCWHINVHEPIIWAAMKFYNDLHLDRIHGSSNITQADPEIQIEWFYTLQKKGDILDVQIFSWNLQNLHGQIYTRNILRYQITGFCWSQICVS
ncbi:uncharacterized protein LOC131078906 isoform X2 [Cryptomeria japonica]|uniref:uncharacterized protein LOC131078906 isoform X2 n=1 Tax=Cryptomeria japonica TaxID=3369 RepID=UPI0027DA3F08|nr:uncharacterized protein LOC131078906 isoform X2 [Cryptomeria japonica]